MPRSHHHKSNPITFAFWLNLCFSIIELIGGLYTNSTAIIADAFHDFMDAMAIGIAALLEKFSNKKADNIYTFGYRRFSILSAIILSGVLVSGSAIMIIESIKSLDIPKEVDSIGMFVLSILGIFINGMAFLKFKTKGEHHHHNHTHSNNNTAIMYHLLEDVLGWIAVLIGAIFIYFTQWYWIDSVLTISIAIFILYNAIKNIISSFKILLLRIPENVDLNKIKYEILHLNKALNIVQLRIWSLDGNNHIATIHLSNLDSSEMQKYKASIRSIFKKHHIDDVLIEIS